MTMAIPYSLRGTHGHTLTTALHGVGIRIGTGVLHGLGATLPVGIGVGASHGDGEVGMTLGTLGVPHGVGDPVGAGVGITIVVPALRVPATRYIPVGLITPVPAQEAHIAIPV